MTRAAIYARYSSDQQSASSIPDQVRLCRKLCDEHGWTVIEVFADEAMSGATHLRPDFQRMQQMALQGGFDVLVSEALDRLSRDQEHIAGLHKRMTYLGIRIVTKAEGEINELHVGLGGTMSALFLRQLAQKTHRGLEGRIRAGKAAGGLSYGYRVDRALLPDGTFTTGNRTVDLHEAAIVQRIFESYAKGTSSRSIAIALNRDGISPPRSGAHTGDGKKWSFSTISGNWKRGTGILNNELYIGKLIWNRQRFIKDPETGRRQARPNPPAAWLSEDVAHLRIIDDTLWQRVKVRQGAIRADILLARSETPDSPRIEIARRARYLLSGLLECGCCGSGYVMISDSRYGCAAARNSGTCSNRKTIRRSEVEERVLGGLKHRLMHPGLVAEFIAEFQRESRKARVEALAARAEDVRKLANVQKDIDGIVTAITDGMYHPALKTRMNELEAERCALEASLGTHGEPETTIIHPGLAEVYARKVAHLAHTLADDSTRTEAAELLRGLIERVILMPDPTTPGGHTIELYGELGAILALCGNGAGTNANARSMASVRQLAVVAGAGFEPAAFRL